MGDKALKLLKSYCASCTIVDKNHFHCKFTNMQIVNDESATHFLKRFMIAHTKAIIANYEYTDDETVDLFLSAVAHTISFHDIERQLLAIDERGKFSKRHSKIVFGLTANNVHTESGNTASEKKAICYHCEKPGHKALECKEPKKQQANHASSSSLMGHRSRDNNRGGGRGYNKYRNQQSRGGGGSLQQANVSQDQSPPQPDTIVHGCSARVIHLDNDLEYFSLEYLECDKTPDLNSPSAC